MKEILVTAPIAIFLYDRLFISGSFRRAREKNKVLYLGFLVPWAVMLMLYLTAHPETVPSEGFALKGMSPADYLFNQGWVILRYLFLSVWPFSLTFDYGLKPGQGGIGIFLADLMVMALIAFACWRYYHRSIIGFLLLLFFLLLAPSSSFFPLKDLIFEYRLYLPLTCLMILLVSGGWRLTKVWPQYSRMTRAVFFIVVIIFSATTIQRNFDYHWPVRMWEDNVKKCPENVRAVSNLGLALNKEKRYNEALYYYDRALLLDPQYPNTYQNLGILLAGQGRYQEAEKCFRDVIRLENHNARAYANLGFVLLDQGRPAEAVIPLRQALALGLRRSGVYRALGKASLQLGRQAEGLWFFERARLAEMNSPELAH